MRFAAGDALGKRSGMRNRKYLVLSLAGLMALGVSSVAWGTATSQQAEWSPAPSPSKQAKKKPKGGVTLGLRTEGHYDNITPGGPAGTPSSHVEQATIHFDKDLAYNDTGIAPCKKTDINTLDTAGAKAKCAASVVGGGSAQINGVGGPDTAVVTAFKGEVPGQLLLHARTGPTYLNQTSVLVGQVGPSSKGGLYGKQLDVKVDPLLNGSVVLLVFQTTLNKIKLPVTKSASSAKKKKKKKPVNYLLMMNCSDKTWNVSGDFRFVDSPGGGTENKTLTGEDTAPCKQKPTKKKKK